jgi:hypothetical protein
MSGRKSYKRKKELKDERDMQRHLSLYHDTVVSDLLGPKPHDNWVKVYDYPTIQQSHLRLGKGDYLLTTSFSDNGSVEHRLEKFGATNRLIRARSFVWGK